MRHISKILFLLYCITLSAVAAEDDKSEVIRNEKYWNQWGDLAGVVKKISSIEMALRSIDHGLSQEFDLKNSNDVTKRKCFIEARECCGEVLFSLYKDLYKSLEKKWQKDLAWDVVYGYSNYVKTLDREWALLMIDVILLDDSLKFTQFLREDFEGDDFKILQNLIYSIKGDERVSQLRVLWSKEIKR